MFDTLLKNATVAVTTPQGKRTWAKVDLGLANGRISQISQNLDAPAAATWDLTGLHVLPGLMDTQVHFREPGLEHKETLATGFSQALHGGITAVFEMPNTKPPTTTKELLKDKMQRASRNPWVDYAFYAGASGENVGQLKELENEPGVCGIKIFMGSSTGTLLVSEDEKLDRILSLTRRRAAIHAEDEDLLKQRHSIVSSDPGNVGNHPLWRNEEVALRATQRICAIAEKHNHPIHVLHVSTAEEISFLRAHKTWASVEVTPNHLTLAAPECYERLGTRAQMNPPVRDKRHMEALWDGIRSGVVDIIGSDHAPHTLEEKSGIYPNTPSGMPGVQTIGNLMIHHVNEGRLSLDKLIDLMVENPVRLFGIKDRGFIKDSAYANLTIVDLKKTWKIENAWLKSKVMWSPFEGMTLNGKIVGTVMRGEMKMWQDEILGDPNGLPLEFQL